MIIITIVTGKLSRVSPYDIVHDTIEYDSVFDITSDDLIKTNYPQNVSDSCKEIIIEDFIESLSKNPKFHNPTCHTSYPIFNGKEIIGNQGYYPVLLECLEDYNNNNNK